MMNAEDQLQESLEKLEAGEPIARCLEGLPEDEAELLKLAAGLQQLEYPLREDAALQAQIDQLIQKAKQEGASAGENPWGFLKWVLPAAAGIFVCMVFTVAAVGLGWMSFRNSRIAERRSATQAAEVAAMPTTTSGSLATDEPESPPAFQVFSLPEYDHPKGANLRDIRGLVEIQDHDGTWIPVRSGHVVAGQGVRTGALSSVTLQLFDGSRILLGADTQISIEKLNAQVDGPRRVALTQWAGESEHDVVPSDDPKSFYDLQTPTATGVVKGTTFRVVVTQELLTRFIVLDGSVSVTNINVTVVVVAGQVVTVEPDEAPGEPVFFIRGEGEVSEIGDVWTIAGQEFHLHPGTVVVGNPQVGDWVFVEGRLVDQDTRLADRIVLLHRASESRFALTGVVEAMQETVWTVSGTSINVDEDTQIDDDIEAGSLVRVEGVISPSGTLQAEEIHLIDEDAGLPFEFVGVVQGITSDTWLISNQEIAIDQGTSIDDGLQLGDTVIVEGRILEDDDWLAFSIERADEAAHEFEITGIVSSIDPWVIEGIAVETRDWTEIEDGIEAGSRVHVEGQILEDGTWVASAIELLEEEGFELVFVGIVTGIDPWEVNGIPLQTDDNTSIEGGIGVGDLVKVKAVIQTDGTFLATSIQRVGEIGGCLSFADLVVSVSSTQIVLTSGTVSISEGVDIEGDVQINSIVLVLGCVDDGEILIVSIIVIHTDTTIISPPPPLDDDDGVFPGGVIVITENNQTLTLTCSGTSVTVNGNSNTITLLGACGSVTVRGNNNWISLQSATSITNTGNNNIIQQH